MKLLKTIVLSLALSTSMAAISTSAYAEAAGASEVKAGITGTITNIEAAIQQIDANATQETLMGLYTEANQSQKLARYEVTERKRQVGAGKLKEARAAILKGDNQGAKASLTEALAVFKDIKQVYDAAH